MSHYYFDYLDRKGEKMARKRASPKRAKVDNGLTTATENDLCVFALTQGDKPFCCLALANHALQGYCVNPQLVRHVHSEFLEGFTQPGEDVWDGDEGYEIQSVMSALCAVLNVEAPTDIPYLGATMLVRQDKALPDKGISDLIDSGWMSGVSDQDIKKDFDLYVVTIPVQQDNVELVHMFALKAFYEEEGDTKTWVVLDVVPGFMPFVVPDIREFLSSEGNLAQNLVSVFQTVHQDDVTVYGVKGDYARRSFHLKSAMEVGLPYNQTEVPAGSPFIYKVFKLADLKSMMVANPVGLLL
jgi:hypothetical protein